MFIVDEKNVPQLLILTGRIRTKTIFHAAYNSNLIQVVRLPMNNWSNAVVSFHFCSNHLVPSFGFVLFLSTNTCIMYAASSWISAWFTFTIALTITTSRFGGFLTTWLSVTCNEILLEMVHSKNSNWSTSGKVVELTNHISWPNHLWLWSTESHWHKNQENNHFEVHC